MQTYITLFRHYLANDRIMIFLGMQVLTPNVGDLPKIGTPLSIADVPSQPTSSNPTPQPAAVPAKAQQQSSANKMVRNAPPPARTQGHLSIFPINQLNPYQNRYISS